MRANRLASIAATVALVAATIVGGAGIAQGQSLDSGSFSAGPVAPRALSLSFTSGADGAAGTLVNNTDLDVECEVLVGPAELILTLEQHLAAGGGLDGPAEFDDVLDLGTAMGVVGVDLLELAGGESGAWEVELSAAEDFDAGAMALCAHEFLYVYEFAYESGGGGSLDLGSLGGELVIGSESAGGSTA